LRPSLYHTPEILLSSEFALFKIWNFYGQTSEMPFTLVEMHRRFVGTCGLHLESDNSKLVNNQQGAFACRLLLAGLLRVSCEVGSDM
jgi:hypothetical protein